VRKIYIEYVGNTDMTPYWSDILIKDEIRLGEDLHSLERIRRHEI